MKFNIIHIEETDSTNRWLRTSQGVRPFVSSDLTKGLTPCEVVVADYQTAGRGCGSNAWESERGKNLTFSMLIRPTEIPANRQFRITEMVSVAMCEMLRKRLPGHEVMIKWPNDIYVGDRKICGMLIENTLRGKTIAESIIGIGLNVNQTEFHSDAPNPVSLRQLTGRETDLDELLNAFLDRFDKTYDGKTTCFGYEEMLYRRGRRHTFKTKTTCFTATLMGVTPEGRLRLRDEQGQERLFAFKEVQFVI